jgi:hypothetical protein
MLARGFQGRLDTPAALVFRKADLALAIAGSAGPVVLRLAVERFL